MVMELGQRNHLVALNHFIPEKAKHCLPIASEKSGKIRENCRLALLFLKRDAIHQAGNNS